MLTHNRRRPPRGFRRCHHPGPSSTPRRASSSRPRSAPSLRAEKILLAAKNLAHGLAPVQFFTLEPPHPCEPRARLSSVESDRQGEPWHGGLALGGRRLLSIAVDREYVSRSGSPSALRRLSSEWSVVAPRPYPL